MLTADRSRLRLYFTDLFEFIFTSNVAHFNFTFNLKTSQEPDATFKVFEGLERVGLEVKKKTETGKQVTSCGHCGRGKVFQWESREALITLS